MNYLKKNKTTIIMILLMLVVCIIKQNLIKDLPILAYAGAAEDDALMVRHTVNMLEGNWLGNYTYNTLVKNIFFSIFLGISKIISLSYTNSVTILYSIACVLFLFCIRKNISNKIFLFITFIFLLFNPIMFSEEVLQRVYRNSLIPSFALIIIGVYIAIFLERNEKIVKYIIYSIIGSITIACFYYTREDSIWLIPFLIFMSTSIVIALVIKFIKEKRFTKNNIVLITSKILLLLLPILTTSVLGKYISNKNYEYYNTKIICTQKNHTKLMSTLYSIKPNEEIYRVSNTKEKLDRIVEVSPTFASIKPEFDKLLGAFENKKTGEIENGLFGWPLITAIYNSGYNTIEKEQQVMNKITEELEDALDNGYLERQKLMPILGGELLEEKDYKIWFNSIIDAIYFIGDYSKIQIARPSASPFNSGLEPYMNQFKYITENRIVLDENARGNNDSVPLELQTQEQYLKSIENEFKILNNIKNIYTKIAIILEILGIVSYVLITVYVLISCIKRKYEMLQEWIILSGIVGAIFTLIVGVSYVHITQTNAIVYLYLAGTYPLFIAFSLIAIYDMVKLIITKIKNRENISKEKENN